MHKLRTNLELEHTCMCTDIHTCVSTENEVLVTHIIYVCTSFLLKYQGKTEIPLFARKHTHILTCTSVSAMVRYVSNSKHLRVLSYTSTTAHRPSHTRLLKYVPSEAMSRLITSIYPPDKVK